MRPTPGNGWKQLGESVWQNAPKGVRIHTAGLILENAARIHTQEVCFWVNLWPMSQRFEQHIRIAGGNRKRGLMTLALELAKGGVS